MPVLEKAVDLSSVSFVIPTMNRARFLRQLVRYYHQQGVACPIYIGDSSGPEQQAVIKGALQEAPSLKAQYAYYSPDVALYSVMADLIKKVDTPYIALHGDDDFFVPRAVLKGVQFLEQHPDYSVVHGEAVLFAVNPDLSLNSGPASRYVQGAREESSAEERLCAHLSDYSTTAFSIHRTAQMRANYEKTVAAGLDVKMAEVITSALSMVQGKAKKLNQLFMVRRAHADQDSVKRSTRFDHIDWVLSPGWNKTFWTACDVLAYALMESVGLSEKKAREVAYRAMKLHMVLHFKMLQELPPTFPQKIKARLRKYPALRPFWLRVRSVLSDATAGHDADLKPVLEAMRS